MPTGATAQSELQTALYTRLTGDATLMSLITGVFDFGSVPTNQPFPYITLGDFTEQSDDTFDRNGFDSTMLLHIWSQARGYQECQKILGRLNALLHRQALALATLNNYFLRYEQAISQDQPDGLTHHLAARYRFLVMQS